MLPKYSETKRLFHRFFQTYAREKARAISPFSESPTRYLHEGRGMAITRADETQTNTGTTQLSTMVEIRHDEIPDLTLDKAIAKYDEMILDIVRQQTGFVLERMSEEIPASQTIDGRGKKLDCELLLEVIDTIQLEFYPDGSPHELLGIGGVFSRERLEAADNQLRNDPELKKRYEELIERKREAWRAREASRKLVG